jgi:hypothetical protein
MNRFKFRRAAIVAASVGLLAATSASAGYLQGQAVVISDADRYANGDLGFVHNSSNRLEFIGCQLGPGFVYCYAQSAEGKYRTCAGGGAAMTNTVRSLKSDSSLTFYWDASGYCTTIYVDNQSSSSHKKPGPTP